MPPNPHYEAVKSLIRESYIEYKSIAQGVSFSKELEISSPEVWEALDKMLSV